mgnify:CR=1 FL=1
METFLIVGASGDIGSAILKKILAMENTVIATYNTKKIEIINKNLEKIQCNVLEHNFDAIINDKINHIVYCVGESCYENLYNASYESFCIQCDLQVYAPLEIIRMALQKKSNIKTITFIASEAGINPSLNSSFYGLAKGMMINMAKVLAKDLIIKGIRVNVIAPGLTYSSMANRLCEKRNITIQEEEERRIDRKLVNPDEIAELCYLLTTHVFRHINGQVIRINSEKNKF